MQKDQQRTIEKLCDVKKLRNHAQYAALADSLRTKPVSRRPVASKRRQTNGKQNLFFEDVEGRSMSWPELLFWTN
jgi:hypothetical protein